MSDWGTFIQMTIRWLGLQPAFRCSTFSQYVYEHFGLFLSDCTYRIVRYICIVQCIHTHTHTYIHTYMCVCTRVRSCVHVVLVLRLFMYMYIYIYIYICVCVCVCVCVYPYIPYLSICNIHTWFDTILYRCVTSKRTSSLTDWVYFTEVSENLWLCVLVFSSNLPKIFRLKAWMKRKVNLTT